MNGRVLWVVPLLLLSSFSSHAADNTGLHGLQLGSVTAFGGAGFSYSSGLSGVHPNFGGGVSVGLHRYFGVFAEGGYSRMGNVNDATCSPACVYTDVKLSFTDFAGGLEVVGTNRSRIVPFAQVGVGYGRGTGSVAFSGFSLSASTGTTAIAFGGGIRAYLSHHVGISVDVMGLRLVGNEGGGTVGVSRLGVFVQSK